MVWSTELCAISGNKCILKFTVKNAIAIVNNFSAYIGEQDFIFSCNNCIKRFHCQQKFNRENLQSLYINFDTKQQEFSCELPCYVDDECKTGTIELSSIENNYPGGNKGKITENPCFLKLARITDICHIFQDGELLKITNRYGYGFGSEFEDDTSLAEDTISLICRISNPSQTCPITRTICRERDELKDFCQEQYKLNFFELQVPEGLDNPMKYTINFKDCALTSDMQYILDNIRKKRLMHRIYNQAEVDCGLVSILLAICYDFRTTQGEATCESGWTRTILSSTLSYFEPVQNLKSVLEIFIRRSLTYPLYRNYELSKQCINDAIEALHQGPQWITKELMITYDLFKTSVDSRQLLNKYYIESYLRFLSTQPETHFKCTLSRNLKNVFFDINKKNIRLNLLNIEGEILTELIKDIHIPCSDDSDDDSTGESSESDSIIYESDESGCENSSQSGQDKIEETQKKEIV